MNVFSMKNLEGTVFAYRSTILSLIKAIFE